MIDLNKSQNYLTCDCPSLVQGVGLKPRYVSTCVGSNPTSHTIPSSSIGRASVL